MGASTWDARRSGEAIVVRADREFVTIINVDGLAHGTELGMAAAGLEPAPAG